MKISMLLALAIGCGALSTFAQDRPAGPRAGGPPRGGGGMMSPLMRALDKNADGVIDAEEIESATATLKALDKNGDGKLTADELMPGRPRGNAPAGQPLRDRPAGRQQAGGQPGRGQQGGGQPGLPEGNRPPIPPLMAVLDANHDGVVDATEINNASAALRTLDKDGDGRLTMAEIQPPGGGRFGGPGGRGPGGRGGPGGFGRGPGGPGGPGGGSPGGGGAPTD